LAIATLRSGATPSAVATSRRDARLATFVGHRDSSGQGNSLDLVNVSVGAPGGGQLPRTSAAPRARTAGIGRRPRSVTACACGPTPRSSGSVRSTCRARTRPSSPGGPLALSPSSCLRACGAEAQSGSRSSEHFARSSRLGCGERRPRRGRARRLRVTQPPSSRGSGKRRARPRHVLRELCFEASARPSFYARGSWQCRAPSMARSRGRLRTSRPAGAADGSAIPGAAAAASLRRSRAQTMRTRTSTFSGKPSHRFR
jgi:hypothetical protein